MRDLKTAVRPFADGLGVAGSAACALHCIAVPVLLVAGTAGSVPFLGDEEFHRALVMVVLPAALVAFGLGCWQHKDARVFWLGALGMAGLCASVALPHEMLGESGERALTLVSAALLITAHVRNFRLCRADDCRHEAAAT